ncbi:competence pheromone ComX [Lysinibacillus fusiformis]|nr:competence pheromone ComX [Lysinibacillus fusiformis]
MMNVIQYLEKNPSLVELLKEQKASLIGISAIEQKAILESFEEEVCVENGLWN